MLGMKITISKIFFVGVFVLSCFLSSKAQEVKEIEVKGQGPGRNEALKNALRVAVGEAIDFSFPNNKIESFNLIKESVQDYMSGYVLSYDILKKDSSSGSVTVKLKAKVSLPAVKSDVLYLAQSVGDLRFLAMYDYHDVPKGENGIFDLTQERINAFLSNKKYRHIDKKRFNALNKQSVLLLKDQGVFVCDNYVQDMGMLSEAQFVVLIKSVNILHQKGVSDTINLTKVSVEVNAIDNCTGDQLGSVLLESNWSHYADEAASMQVGIDDALNNGFDKVLSMYIHYIGSWIKQGTPYQVRLYSMGSQTELEDLKTKVKADNSISGDFEMLHGAKVTTMKCNFRKKPDDLVDKMMDHADEVNTLFNKKMDIKLMYGRQLYFGPFDLDMPEPSDSDMVQVDDASAADEINTDTTTSLSEASLDSIDAIHEANAERESILKANGLVKNIENNPNKVSSAKLIGQSKASASKVSVARKSPTASVSKKKSVSKKSSSRTASRRKSSSKKSVHKKSSSKVSSSKSHKGAKHPAKKAKKKKH